MSNSNRSKLRISSTIVLLAMALVLGRQADAANTKVAEVIVVRNASPASVMYSLGLSSFDDYLAGKPLIWNAADSKGRPPSSNVMPAGIDLIVSYELDKSLIVYGTKEAVGKLRSTISLLDFKPKNIEVRAELYKLDSETARKTGILKPDSKQLDTSAATADASVIGNLRDSLKQSKAVLVNSPTVTTPNNIPASIEISSDAQSSKLSVLPRVNADKSITLYLWWTMKQDPLAGEQSYRTNRRVKSGETIVIGGMTTDQNEHLLSFVSVRIVD